MTTPQIEILSTGDIFASGCGAIVIPVNCVATAGAGLALLAKRKWPSWFKIYSEVCLKESFEPGDIAVTPFLDPLWIVALATKGHWRNPSEIAWIEKGLNALVEWANGAGLRPESIAIPALGCGFGGLPWSEVQPMVEDAGRRMTNAKRVRIFAPREARR